MTFKYKINHETGTEYIWGFYTAKEAKKTIETLGGAKSLDYISFYDDSSKLVKRYSPMHTLPNEVADSRTKIEIANQFKNGASVCIFVRDLKNYGLELTNN